MMIEHLFRVSNRFVEVFNKNVYENAVLDLMNKSKKVFPNQYTKLNSNRMASAILLMLYLVKI